jgi:hypothetical protein
MKCVDWGMPLVGMCAILLTFGGTCSGQQSPSALSAAAAPLPNEPGAQTGASTPAGPPASAPQIDEEQQKRIMGMLPNFRSVTAGQVVPPETTRQKLATATQDNFDYTSLFFAGVIAADSFVTKATPEFHQGAAGYGRYYWHTVADQGIENYSVELIFPALTHEDSRYYAMGREGGGGWKRLGYSLSRAVVTRKDSGQPTFNISEIAGSAMASSISDFYYPANQRNVPTGLRDWGLDITYDAITFAFHEFWPDISNALFSKKNKAPATVP